MYIFSLTNRITLAKGYDPPLLFMGVDCYPCLATWLILCCFHDFLYSCSPEEEGYTVLPLSVCPSVLPSVQDIFRRIFLSNYRWQKSDIWSQASYKYAILWVAFLDPSDSYFLFADLVDFYAHWTYMRGYHKRTLAHSSSCSSLFIFANDYN